jgi:hypothetical protein
MTTAAVPELLPDAYLQLEPDMLESRIGFLMWRYQVAPSQGKALTIVRHLEALCRHPDLERFAIARCHYQRAMAGWRLIAGWPADALRA